MAALLSTLTINAAFFREIKQDQIQLGRLMSQLNWMASQPQRIEHQPEKFQIAAQQLVDQLGLHFSLEEAYGYFENAIDEAPRLHDMAIQLRDEHKVLYLSAQQLVDLSTDSQAEPDYAWWAEQFNRFEKQFKAHETAENRLIQESFNRVLGTGD
jgi:hypothetical protein